MRILNNISVCTSHSSISGEVYLANQNLQTQLQLLELLRSVHVPCPHKLTDTGRRQVLLLGASPLRLPKYTGQSMDNLHTTDTLDRFCIVTCGRRDCHVDSLMLLPLDCAINLIDFCLKVGSCMQSDDIIGRNQSGCIAMCQRL